MAVLCICVHFNGLDAINLISVRLRLRLWQSIDVPEHAACEYMFVWVCWRLDELMAEMHVRYQYIGYRFYTYEYVQNVNARRTEYTIWKMVFDATKPGHGHGHNRYAYFDENARV